MTYRGEIRNGVVVFSEAPPLKDGTAVDVEAVGAEQSPRPGGPEAMRRCDVRWSGPPDEIDELLSAVQAARESDLTPTDEQP